jgi:hypothetical protein
MDAVDNSTARDNGPRSAHGSPSGDAMGDVKHGDDRFRHRLRNCEKRAEDAGLSRKRSLQTTGANLKRTDVALAA